MSSGINTLLTPAQHQLVNAPLPPTHPIQSTRPVSSVHAQPVPSTAHHVHPNATQKHGDVFNQAAANAAKDANATDRAATQSQVKAPQSSYNNNDHVNRPVSHISPTSSVHVQTHEPANNNKAPGIGSSNNRFSSAGGVGGAGSSLGAEMNDYLNRQYA